MKVTLPVAVLLSPLVLKGFFRTVSRALIGTLGVAGANWVSDLLFAIYWIWVGYYFSHLEMPRRRGLLVGLAPTAIGLLLYALRISIARGGSPFLIVASQIYVEYLFYWVSRLVSIFTHNVSGRLVVIVAYALLYGLFVIGYTIGAYLNARNRSIKMTETPH